MTSLDLSTEPAAKPTATYAFALLVLTGCLLALAVLLSKLAATQAAPMLWYLAAAMGVKDLVEFSVHYGDESEGNGLGLAMVVLLIKDMGFDPGFFRVYLNDGYTTARLEFPLSADYTPLRGRQDL